MSQHMFKKRILNMITFFCAFIFLYSFFVSSIYSFSLLPEKKSHSNVFKECISFLEIDIAYERLEKNRENIFHSRRDFFYSDLLLVINEQKSRLIHFLNIKHTYQFHRLNVLASQAHPPTA